MVSLNGLLNWQAVGRELAAGDRDRKKTARRQGIHESQAPNRAERELCLAILEGQVAANEYSLARAFESLVPNGHEILRSWQGSMAGRPQGVNLVKESINTSAFAHINQAFMYQKLMEQFNKPELIAQQLVTIEPTTKKWERKPGVGQLGDGARKVAEGDDYPRVTLNEDWVETQETEKRGFIVEVTKEAILFDETGMVLSMASKGAEWLAVNWEKRILDTVFGLVDRYHRKGRGIVATYGNNSGDHDWDNLQTNALVDYESIEAADLLFEDLTDPDTGEPIVIGARQMVVPGALYQTAQSIINATEIRRNTQATADVGFAASRSYSNPYSGLPAPITSPYVKARTSSSSSWFYGDFKKAFKYMQNWAPETVTAIAGNEDEFERDIAFKSKSSEMGQVAVDEPRCVQKNTE
ncbi:phage major capsid protein [Blastopirellula retiformator]|uniref:Mu-like prophage major head subunit gpT n=1 Tax=Blastopirellula retiformator TaxID=2527970 RepID=A0A5C5UWI7_9BACT|nr:hypothetical protein [Blastopirellula retiformator]TWT30711.1 hypothetical protein Enr8_42340 [Blastopirellula retiformator]